MREYRRDNSRKRDSDEGYIARYERYRYGGGTPQYNDLGSEWTIEQLINDPNDPLYDPEEEYFVVNNMNEWEYRDELDWEESQNAEQTELLKKDYRKRETPPQTSYSPKKGYISRQDEERKRRFRPGYVPIYERFDPIEKPTSTNLNNSKGKRGYISRQDEERKRRFRPGYVPIYERHLVNRSTEEKSTQKQKSGEGDRSTAPKSSELLLARINLDTKQEEQSQPLNVADMSATEKLGEAMKRAAKKLPKAVGEQLLAMVNPTSLAIMVGVLGAYAASHAVGIGVIADAVMAVGAGATIGWQAVSAGKELWGFAQFINATTEEDLDKAGQHLANFVATVGIDVVLGILVKKVAGKAKNYGDDLNSVDEVSAHSDDVTSSRVNDVDNANKTPSTNTEVNPKTANDIDIEYPEGISYRQDLPKHLRDFDGIGKNGIQGTHNLDTFNKLVAEKGIKIVSKTEHPTVKGIYKIEYQVPQLDKQLRPTGDFKKPREKTVYDPSLHSDEKILKLSQEAAAKGLDDAISQGQKQFNMTVGGIEFRVYVNLNTKEVTNVHPNMN